MVLTKGQVERRTILDLRIPGVAGLRLGLGVRHGGLHGLSAGGGEDGLGSEIHAGGEQTRHQEPQSDLRPAFRGAEEPALLPAPLDRGEVVSSHQ